MKKKENNLWMQMHGKMGFTQMQESTPTAANQTNVPQEAQSIR